MKMELKNREGLEEFNIRPDWYINRIPGISAMIRCANEEKWIVACLKSIFPLFDEIVVTVGPSKDKTKEVLDDFVLDVERRQKRMKGTSKVKVFDYPFSLTEPDPEADSVNDKSFYYNWTLSKTTHEIVAKWDVDMLLIPEMCACLHDLAIQKNVVRLQGYNVVEIDPYYLSKTNPIEHYEPRFMRINKFIHYVQAPSYMPKPIHGRELFTYDAAGLLPHIRQWYHIDMPSWLYLYRMYNAITRKDVSLKTPAFIHTKYLKLKENPESSWAPNWKEEIQRGKKLNGVARMVAVS